MDGTGHALPQTVEAGAKEKRRAWARCDPSGFCCHDKPVCGNLSWPDCCQIALESGELGGVESDDFES